eukprot:Ihof_evm8s215 gene=Ihof_evmTU8s215
MTRSMRECIALVGQKIKHLRAKDRSEAKVEINNLDSDHFSWGRFARFLGPGMLVSIAYLDPGNFLSDIQSGAEFNYRLIWVLWMATFLGFLMQLLSARLGIVTGKHLAVMCRREYGNRTFITYCLWILSEITIVASDIPEVIGSAFGMKLLFGLPLWAGVLIVSANTFILLGVQYFGVRKLEIVVSILIAIIAGCFVGETALSPVQWTLLKCPSNEEWTKLLACTDAIDYCPANLCGSFWGGFIPRISLNQRMLMIATSLIGAVVMPHNLYLHSALVLSRNVNRKAPVQVKWADFYNTVECGIALGLSCLINTTIIIVAASIFFPNAYNNYHVVNNLDNIGFMDVSKLLGDTLGSKGASIMFGIALLASGQSSTITGTYAGQFVMEGFLELKIVLWQRNLLTRAVAIIPSLTISILAGVKGANTLIIVSSVILSFQLPYALVPLLKFTSSEVTMGQHKNSILMIVTCVILTLIVVLANVFLIVNTVLDSVEGKAKIGMICFVAIIGVVYFGSLGYLAWKPVSPVIDDDEVMGDDLGDGDDANDTLRIEMAEHS